jgi:hypothetical protein
MVSFALDVWDIWRLRQMVFSNREVGEYSSFLNPLLFLYIPGTSFIN